MVPGQEPDNVTKMPPKVGELDGCIEVTLGNSNATAPMRFITRPLATTLRSASPPGPRGTMQRIIWLPIQMVCRHGLPPMSAATPLFDSPKFLPKITIHHPPYHGPLACREPSSFLSRLCGNVRISRHARSSNDATPPTRGQ